MPTKRTNTKAAATENYLLDQYGETDVDTAVEKILGLSHRGEDPLEFHGELVDQNPDVDFYCADKTNKQNVRQAERQGFKPLPAGSKIALRRGLDADHDLFMFRPKVVSKRVRAAEARARAEAQGKTFQHETRDRRENVSVTIHGDAFGD